MNNDNDIPVRFTCDDDTLFGIVHNAHPSEETGLLFIVGGPQYRIGSHRQFTLLARQISAADFAVMRFDQRGSGDSSGDARPFDAIQDDIRAAIDCFFLHASSIKKIVLWGLCDGASAALFYAGTDHRVCGVCLVNPWAFSETGRAHTLIKHYYWRRLFDPIFWKKCLKRDVQFTASMQSLWTQLSLLKGKIWEFLPIVKQRHASGNQLHEQIYQSLLRFHGKILIIICDADLTAREFDELIHSTKKWRAILHKRSIQIHHLADANHTFALKIWRDQIGDWTINWLQSEMAVTDRSPPAASKFGQNIVELS